MNRIESIRERMAALKPYVTRELIAELAQVNKGTMINGIFKNYPIKEEKLRAIENALDKIENLRKGS